MAIRSLVGLGLGLGLGLSQLASAVPTTYPESNSTDAKLGAVASESAVCSNIGIKLLEQGGNAIDAMVGTTFCVGVIGMYHSDIGGGGFALVKSPNGTYECVDFERLPQHPTMRPCMSTHRLEPVRWSCSVSTYLD